jgi:hypothetical protein
LEFLSLALAAEAVKVRALTFTFSCDEDANGVVDFSQRLTERLFPALSAKEKREHTPDGSLQLVNLVLDRCFD